MNIANSKTSESHTLRINFLADYISQISRIFAFRKNIIRAKYHKISHLRNLI